MVSTEDRLKAIELEKQGYPKTEIAKMLNVSRQTVYEWLKDAEEKDAPEQESGKSLPSLWRRYCTHVVQKGHGGHSGKR